MSGDALDKLLQAIGMIAEGVHALEKKVDSCALEVKVTTQSVRELRKDHANLLTRVDDIANRLATAERNVRRHDSTFAQTSEVDAKHASEMAALVIALDDTRKLAKKALEKIEEVDKETKEERAETAAQTPVLARVDAQTKGMSLPTKAAALINLIIGIVYLIIEILKHAK
jgi:uncharacterized coiled-coil DUF342 family protein